jgi:hypothetical protein
MNTVLLSAALIVLLALFLWVHAGLAFGLISLRRPRWQGLLVLLPPLWWLAPYWGYQAGLRKRAWAWLITLVGYVAVRAIGAYTA